MKLLSFIVQKVSGFLNAEWFKLPIKKNSIKFIIISEGYINNIF